MELLDSALKYVLTERFLTTSLEHFNLYITFVERTPISLIFVKHVDITRRILS